MWCCRVSEAASAERLQRLLPYLSCASIAHACKAESTLISFALSLNAPGPENESVSHSCVAAPLRLDELMPDRLQFRR